MLGLLLWTQMCLLAQPMSIARGDTGATQCHIAHDSLHVLILDGFLTSREHDFKARNLSELQLAAQWLSGASVPTEMVRAVMLTRSGRPICPAGCVAVWLSAFTAASIKK